jgi:hypothetical protein
MADKEQQGNSERDKEQSSNQRKRSGGGQGEQYSKGTHSYQNDEGDQAGERGGQQSDKQRERIGSRDNNDHDAHDDESGKIIRQGSRTK